MHDYGTRHEMKGFTQTVAPKQSVNPLSLEFLDDILQRYDRPAVCSTHPTRPNGFPSATAGSILKGEGSIWQSVSPVGLRGKRRLFYIYR